MCAVQLESANQYPKWLEKNPDLELRMGLSDCIHCIFIEMVQLFTSFAIFCLQE